MFRKKITVGVGCCCNILEKWNQPIVEFVIFVEQRVIPAFLTMYFIVIERRSSQN